VGQAQAHDFGVGPARGPKHLLRQVGERGIGDIEAAAGHRPGEDGFRHFSPLLAVLSPFCRLFPPAYFLIAAEVIASMSEAVCVSDLDFRFTSVNRAFTRMSGYTEAEVIGQSASILNGAQHPQEFYLSMRAEFVNTGHWRGELWQRRKDGEEFLCWLEISTVRDAPALGQGLDQLAMKGSVPTQRRRVVSRRTPESTHRESTENTR
jgi:PAS domain S-box-containing protein